MNSFGMISCILDYYLEDVQLLRQKYCHMQNLYWKDAPKKVQFQSRSLYSYKHTSFGTYTIIKENEVKIL